MNKELVITNVYTFNNGMVMVFDQYGQQMAEYQGRLDEMQEKLELAGWPLHRIELMVRK